MIPIITGSDGYIGTNLKNVFDKHERPYAGLDRKSGPDLLVPKVAISLKNVL